ncbi:MAG: PIN domain-containing protein [Actinobacteria bacterium]|nr:PIN domain-containing protein [Actinomycetota bacterium]
MAGVIVLDASVMIAVLDRADPHFDTAKDLLAENVSQRLSAHRLTVSETLIQPVRSGRGAEVAAALDLLGVEPIDILDDPLELATARAESGLTTPDGCVRLAAAARTIGVRVIP